jgi:hypothetical protein
MQHESLANILGIAAARSWSCVDFFLWGFNMWLSSVQALTNMTSDVTTTGKILQFNMPEQLLESG